MFCWCRRRIELWRNSTTFIRCSGAASETPTHINFAMAFVAQFIVTWYGPSNTEHESTQHLLLQWQATAMATTAPTICASLVGSLLLPRFIYSQCRVGRNIMIYQLVVLQVFCVASHEKLDWTRISTSMARIHYKFMNENCILSRAHVCCTPQEACEYLRWWLRQQMLWKQRFSNSHTHTHTT